MIPYKFKAEERFQIESFYPSFASLIFDFEVLIKCQGCGVFDKKSALGLCGLCNFYVQMGFWNRLQKRKTYQPSIEFPSQKTIDEIINSALQLIYNFEHFHDGQYEAIRAFCQGYNTFVIMKTGNGKSLCYSISALYFEGLTVILSPLKALIEDQKVYYIISKFFLLYTIC